MKRILFFATRQDLLPMLAAVEGDIALQYVRTGDAQNAIPQSFARSADIPNLGKATADSAINSESFLVAKCGAQVRVRSIRTIAGAERFLVDQLINLDTVTFAPGGMWRDDVVLHGRFATGSDSPASQELMKRFSSAFKKAFRKIKAFWVGPEAIELLRAGKRLTISAQSPRDLDLSL